MTRAMTRSISIDKLQQIVLNKHWSQFMPNY